MDSIQDNVILLVLLVELDGVFSTELELLVCAGEDIVHYLSDRAGEDER